MNGFLTLSALTANALATLPTHLLPSQPVTASTASTPPHRQPAKKSVKKIGTHHFILALCTLTRI